MMAQDAWARAGVWACHWRHSSRAGVQACAGPAACPEGHSLQSLASSPTPRGRHLWVQFPGSGALGPAPWRRWLVQACWVGGSAQLGVAEGDRPPSEGPGPLLCSVSPHSGGGNQGSASAPPVTSTSPLPTPAQVTTLPLHASQVSPGLPTPSC